MLLVRARVIDFSISLPADLDVIAILLGVGVSSFVAINLALREGWERLRQQSIKQVRSEAFAEHLRFLRRLDHELKNPLLAARTDLANLSDTLEREDQRQLVMRVETQMQRISRLVTDLRKLVELETVPLEISAINIADLLQEAVTLVRDRSDAQERKLVLSLPKPPVSLPQFTGDQDLLLLALHNLLDNALKYTRPGDTVKLQAFPQNGTVIVEITDTGSGIPEPELPLVWEELYRGKSVEGIPGTGVGLALALAIIERHHGEIGLQSEVGKGTNVRICLPLD